MIGEIFENLYNSTNLLDVFFSNNFNFFVIQCFLKGFSLSLISFMKWVLSTIITIILVPKFQPTVSSYIESEFINSIGLGFTIFCLAFSSILVGKSLSKVVTWSGVGSVDKSFGLLFGFLKVML